MQTCVQAELTMWPRGFPSTRIAPSLPTHAHLSWPLPAAGPELYILFYWISGCWVLIWCYLSNGGGSLGDYGREPESEVLGWGPGCTIYKLSASPCPFPLGLYFLVPRWANNLAGKLGGLGEVLHGRCSLRGRDSGFCSLQMSMGKFVICTT